MPTNTTNYGFNKPNVNSADDEDLWGGQLNDNWDALDTLLKQLLPVGAPIPFAGSTAPTGFLLANGQEVSRTTYADLYAVIGDTYGAGDGSTTFNVPDMRGRMVIGLDNMGGTSADRVTSTEADTLGGTEGSENKTGATDEHVLVESEIPEHYHHVAVDVSNTGALTADNSISRSRGSGNDTAYTLSSDGSSTPTLGRTSTVGSDGGHDHDITDFDVMNPYIAMNYIIKF